MISIYKLDFIGIEIFTRWTWNTPCSPISIGRITPASTPSTSLKYTTTDAFCPCRRPLRASRESQITFLKSSGARIFWKLEKILTSFHFYQKFYVQKWIIFHCIVVIPLRFQRTISESTPVCPSALANQAGFPGFPGVSRSVCCKYLHLSHFSHSFFATSKSFQQHCLCAQIQLFGGLLSFHHKTVNGETPGMEIQFPKEDDNYLKTYHRITNLRNSLINISIKETRRTLATFAYSINAMKVWRALRIVLAF